VLPSFNSFSRSLCPIGLYLEAGAIPAMLLQISEAFDMSSGLQGVLGGIAYLSLGFGSPFAGYLLRNYNHKVVLGYAIGVNNLLTLLWSLTPVGFWYSSTLFISIRFLMGLMQCVVCVFLPLWTNEFAPPLERTKWMGALQVDFDLCVLSFSLFLLIL
jgi:MFS family permease